MKGNLEMRWLHSKGNCAEDFMEDGVVLVKLASDPHSHIPLTLQHRECWTDAAGTCCTEWVDVLIVKED